jgi:hypothetical protein
MLFAEASDAVQITSAILSFLAILLAPLVAVLAANLKSMNSRLLEEKSRKLSYKSIAMDAVASNKEMANSMLIKDGRAPLPTVADVVPEAHSPSTERQREEATIATLRAEMAQIRLAAGQEPKPHPPHATAAEEKERK